MSNRKKVISFFAFSYLVALVFFLWGVASGYYKVFPWKQMYSVYNNLQAFLAFSDGASKSTKDKLFLERLESRNHFEYGGFRLVDKDFIDSGYLLLSRFTLNPNRSIIELFSIAEEKVIHTWAPPFEDIAAKAPHFATGDLTYQHPTHKTENNRVDFYRPMHPQLLEDGELVFNISQGPMVRLDACSSLIWVIDRQFHHSVEIDYLGNIVSPVILEAQRSWPIKKYRDDGFAVISADGRIIQEYSVTDILIKSGFAGLVFGVGRVAPDRIHLNDAQPILISIAEAETGDIALSSRTLSTVLLYRPRTEKVVWIKTGPWLKQHDINQLGNGNYSIFGNDIIIQENGKTFFIEGERSDIYIYNALRNEVSRPYSDMMSEHRIATYSEGRSEVLKNGDVFIEENNRNRLLRMSADTIRWEYVNSITPTTVGLLHWVRYIAKEDIDLSWIKEGVTCQ